MKDEYVCLKCPLFECKEGARGCLYTNPRKEINKRYYDKQKQLRLVTIERAKRTDDGRDERAKTVLDQLLNV
jgi:hypothetical protein